MNQMSGLMNSYGQVATTVPLAPYEAAANSWANAKARLIRARCEADQAAAELLDAEQAEQQAWSAMEAEAGRSVPCVPPPNMRIR
jgi:hypothetical protein